MEQLDAFYTAIQGGTCTYPSATSGITLAASTASLTTYYGDTNTNEPELFQCSK